VLLAWGALDVDSCVALVTPGAAGGLAMKLLAVSMLDQEILKAAVKRMERPGKP
jgi:hypothetical protein